MGVYTGKSKKKIKGRRLHRSRVDPGCGGCDHEDYRSCVPYPADKHIRGMRETVFHGYAYQVYAIALMLSSLSLPTAVSKLVSVRMAVGQRRNAFRVFLMFPYICCFGRNYYISCDLSRSRSDFGTYDESAFQCLRT